MKNNHIRTYRCSVCKNNTDFFAFSDPSRPEKPLPKRQHLGYCETCEADTWKVLVPPEPKEGE